jgi:hypothetical protein
VLPSCKRRCWGKGQDWLGWGPARYHLTSMLQAQIDHRHTPIMTSLRVCPSRSLDPRSIDRCLSPVVRSTPPQGIWPSCPSASGEFGQTPTSLTRRVALAAHKPNRADTYPDPR